MYSSSCIVFLLAIEHVFSISLKNLKREDGDTVDQSHVQRTRSMSARQTQGHNSNYEEEHAYDDGWSSPRMPSSARRYQSDVRTDAGRTQGDTQVPSLRDGESYVVRRSSVPARRTATQVDIPIVQNGRRSGGYTDDVLPRRTSELLTDPGKASPRFHWLVFVGIAMIVMLAGWMLLSMVMSWWQVTQDDIHYGRPRTYQTDQAVGHNDSSSNPSHFIALNLNRHIEIIEFPGGDATKARIYIGPVLIGQGQDLSVVTLTFKDVNGDGKPDMIVNVQDSRFVFINENNTFRPARAGENVQL